MVGLGDLGARVLAGLAREPAIGRLVGTTRDPERGEALVAQAALGAEMLGGPAVVEHFFADVEDVEATATLLRRLAPAVVVAAVSGHTWWRGSDSLPYAAWLPLHVRPVRRLMEALRAAGSGARVVCLPFPDAVGPILAGLGLAPDAGAGNVAEVAAKLRVLAGADATVRLVMHHAAERLAIGGFEGVAASGGEPGDPPWRASVHVGGERLPDEVVAELFRRPFSLPAGREAQWISAAATVALVRALLGDAPTRVHAPAVGGRPGGYPALASSAGLELDLPDGVDEAEAIAVNAEAARWDGIAAIESDGTIVYTSGERIAASDLDAAAESLRERQAALRGG